MHFMKKKKKKKKRCVVRCSDRSLFLYCCLWLQFQFILNNFSPSLSRSLLLKVFLVCTKLAIAPNGRKKSRNAVDDDGIWQQESERENRKAEQTRDRTGVSKAKFVVMSSSSSLLAALLVSQLFTSALETHQNEHNNHFDKIAAQKCIQRTLVTTRARQPSFFAHCFYHSVPYFI